MKRVIIGKVIKGIFNHYDMLNMNLRTLEGLPVKITVEEAKSQRSGKQGRYYWGVVVPLVVNMFREAGELASPEYVHRYLKGQVGGMKKPVANPDGTKGWDVDTSTKLTTAEWEDWMTAIRAWAAQFGLSIPMPNE